MRTLWRILLLSIGLAVILPTSPVWSQDDDRDGTNTTLLLPTAPGAGGRASLSLPESDGEVFGVLGTLQAAISQSFSTYLLIADGRRVALVGQSPDVERRITTLRDQQPDEQIKIWGLYDAPTPNGEGARVVVSDIIPAEQTDPSFGLPVATIQFELVNLRLGPGNRFGRGGQVTRGQQCIVINRNNTQTWYFVDCPNNVTGWIDGRLVDVQGNLTNVQVSEFVVDGPTPPTPAPTTVPQPTPTVVLPPSSFWSGHFFPNPSLTEPIVFAMNTGQIDFNWDGGSPDANLPVNGFSARFERTFDLSNGYYRFEANADDGVRVYLDDQLIIDEWHGAAERSYVIGRTLNGRHVVRVEYYEATGDAHLRFLIEQGGDELIWDASYYNGVDLAGAPVLTQQEGRSTIPIDYNWGMSSPVPAALSRDNWSARWVGEFDFNPGNYVFRAIADGGVRVYLNDQPVIDEWRTGYREVRNRFSGVGEGKHTIRVEYNDRSGSALLRLWWYKESRGPIQE